MQAVQRCNVCRYLVLVMVLVMMLVLVLMLVYKYSLGPVGREGRKELLLLPLPPPPPSVNVKIISGLEDAPRPLAAPGLSLMTGCLALVS